MKTKYKNGFEYIPSTNFMQRPCRNCKIEIANQHNKWNNRQTGLCNECYEKFFPYTVPDDHKFCSICHGLRFTLALSGNKGLYTKGWIFARRCVRCDGEGVVKMPRGMTRDPSYKYTRQPILETQ